jgi:hypothetical protein
MLRTHATSTRRRLAGSLALLCVLCAPQAFAQAPAPAPAPVPAPAPAPAVAPAATPASAAGATDPAAVATDADSAAAAKPTEAPPAADSATLSQRLDKLQQAFDELKAQQDAAAAAAIPADDGESESESEALKIYGFMDMGVQHIWINEQSLLARLFQVNNTSFVVGNVNLYFDAQPIKHFRALAELHVTNAPLGDIVNYGGLAGNFQRKDTFSYDSSGTAINAPIWAATVVLERAWIEWNEHQALKLRFGSFFTPFGIWNEDHGTPTLISLALPQFIVQRWMPIRQTGIMAHGNAFAGDWELGYAATLSNGRQEISNYNFDNNFGVGGRVYARRDTGHVNTTFGASYFTGKTSDEEVDFVASPTGVNGINVVKKTRSEYTEHVAGVDLAVDIDATRIRSEAVVRRVVYEPGKRVPGDPLFAPGSFAPDGWRHEAYVLVANQLPWAGIEPYVMGGVEQLPVVIGDLIFTASAGVNVHFNSSVQWKTQAQRAFVTNGLFDSPFDTSINNTTSLYSRIVMAF